MRPSPPGPGRHTESPLGYRFPPADGTGELFHSGFSPNVSVQGQSGLNVPRMTSGRPSLSALISNYAQLSWLERGGKGAALGRTPGLNAACICAVALPCEHDRRTADTAAAAYWGWHVDVYGLR